MGTKQIIKDFSPPVLWNLARKMKRQIKLKMNSLKTSEGSQDLDPYWQEEMAKLLDMWGEGNAWNEIGMFFLNTKGKVLDIACGTGKVMGILEKINPELEVYGFDISDMLIQKAVDKGLKKERLAVCDATNMKIYANDSFDYAYTIGSLEHFTEEGIAALVKETKRVVKKSCFHMMPTSRSGKDEGWMKTYQSFFNNSPEWWVAKFKKDFSDVKVFDSAWNDELSVGKWFVTTK